MRLSIECKFKYICETGNFCTNLQLFFRAEECKNGTQNNKLAIIVHGWAESCEKPWAMNLKESEYVYINRNVRKLTSKCKLLRSKNPSRRVHYVHGLFKVFGTNVPPIESKAFRGYCNAINE